MIRGAYAKKVRPAEVLRDIRKSISKILDKPFAEKIDHRIFKRDQKILALWAADCAEHVLPFFEDKYPADDRPRKAIEACRKWANSGDFRMTEIRTASLDSHAAARTARERDAFFAARSAGQAVATAHVVTHSLGSAVYAIRAVAAHTGNVDDGLLKERDWQLRRLLKYVRIS